MTLKPKLSICVPSRNRQIYFRKTIEDLLRTLRLDVEFVFADNSDDPSIMNDFMVEVQRDPRVVYLPATGQTLSMVDNWERTVAATSGEWVIVIGDDDYVDPDAIILLDRIEKEFPKTDAVSWGIVSYLWPHADRSATSSYVPFNSDIYQVDRSLAIARLFGWQDAAMVPTSGFSIYHSAISRRLLEKIRTLYGGRYFEHPTVDYDNGMKVVVTGENFIYCARPIGIMGKCPESNSFSIGRLDDLRKKMAAFMADVGRDIDEDDYMAGFPFRTALGVTACIAQVQHWFKQKYKLNYTGWEKNFAMACARNVEAFVDPQAFEIVAAGYRAAFQAWENGKYLEFFDPKPPGERIPIVVTGFAEGGAYIDQGIAGIATPAELYAVVNGMTTPLDMIDISQKTVRMLGEPQKKKGKAVAR